MKFLSFSCCALILAGCIQHQDQVEKIVPAELNDQVEVHYAEGFEVNYDQGGVQIVSHSIGENSPFADSIYIVTNPEVDVMLRAHAIPSVIKSVACQSSTHLPFLDVLGKLELVKGLCGLNYVSNKDILRVLNENRVAEICTAESVNLEPIQKMNPDLFFIYPFDTEGKEEYNRSGIRTFYVAEYLEQSALARLEWIKVFGLITGKVREANEYFHLAEEKYNSLKKESTAESPTFILNLPYKEKWFMPSANSMIVDLIEDAGLRYFYESSGRTENDPHSTEEVWHDGSQADYWIIMANRPEGFSKKDLLAEEAVYNEFKAVKEGHVIFCNTAVSDYFLTGVVEPEVILKDIIHATAELEGHQPKYFFKLF